VTVPTLVVLARRNRPWTEELVGRICRACHDWRLIIAELPVVEIQGVLIGVLKAGSPEIPQNSIITVWW
jgi:hypothetical protein